MTKLPDLEGSVPTGGGVSPTWCGLDHAEVDAADVLPRVDGRCVNEAMPRLRDASGGEVLAPRPPRGLGFYPPEDVTLDAVVSTLGSLDILDFGANELGLPGYPRACWR
jgi:hypothetical protein